MYIKETQTTPEKVRVLRIPEVSLINNSTPSRRKVIKDYVYTPEFRLIRS